MDKAIHSFYSDTSCNHASNHFPVFVQLSTEKYHKEEPTQYKVQRYFTADDRQKNEFNKEVKKLINQGNTFSSALNKAAEATLTPKSPDLKKDYLTKETWDLITQRDIRAVNKNTTEVHRLNQEIRRKAKADKENDFFTKFNLQEDDQYNRKAWKTIKQLRTK